MADQDRKHYYRAVPGSRELVTSSSQSARALLELESAADEGASAGPVEFEGEWLGEARFDDRITLPADLFDLLAPRLSALEQAVLFHLFRRSYGEGRNWCRAGKRELMGRAQVSERRLNVGLDGLVVKGCIKPLHRNTRGTLYRVYLPSEIMSAPGPGPGQAPETGREDQKPGTPPALPASQKREPMRQRPLESPLNEERFADVSGRKPGGPGVGEMADRFFALKGQKPKPASRQTAVSVLTGLLEDGFSREEVLAALVWFAENQPGEMTLDRLPYYMTAALEEGR